MHGTALVGAMLALTLAAGPAAAAGFCGSVEALVAEARAGFPDAEPAMLEGAADCRFTRMLSGGVEHGCRWDFDLQDPEAAETFARFARELGDCFGARAEAVEDLGVNHPDFYDQRSYRLDGVEVTVAIKDKGALRSTHVFVRTRRLVAD